MTEDKSTPRPWPEPIYDNDDVNDSFSEWWDILGVARFYNEANATLVRDAVNSHDAMKECVEALKEFVATYTDVYLKDAGDPYRKHTITGKAFAKCEAALSKLEKANG